jgi:glycosyltransferase involved in cell wall biosynthesis
MRIGFVSTRLAGTDGVSLETAKLAAIYQRLGHDVCFCAGQLDPEFAPGRLVPEMHFTHPEALWIHDYSFGIRQEVPDLRPRITAMAGYLQAATESFLIDFQVDVLCIQNAVAIPMHVALGLALARTIAATGIPTLAHNHDLYWERERFSITCIPDILDQAFPPALPSVQHLVINSLAQQALRERLNVEAALLPNIFDFASAAPALTPFNTDLRTQLGLSDDHLLILQPTRVIARKGIEFSIELVRRLQEPAPRAQLLGKRPVLLLAHHAGDEGLGYLRQLQALAKVSDVGLIYAADRFAPQASGQGQDKTYALWDAYVHADFVTYPSLIEGFGNALLETLYFRLPALVNRYPVYAADIASKGFDLIEIDADEAVPGQVITDQVVNTVVGTIMDPVRHRRLVELNYNVARQHYSYEAVTPLLASLLVSF